MTGSPPGTDERARTAASRAPNPRLGDRLGHHLIPAPLHYRYTALKGYLGAERELGLLRFLVDPARTSVDVGAGKGVYTYWLQRRSRHVYAYEPNPRFHAFLKRAVRGNATVSNVALSDRAGAATRRLDDEGLEDVGFLRIDVAGHEAAVIEGAKALIARDRPALLVGIAACSPEEAAEDSVARMRALGYQALALTARGLVRVSRLDAGERRRLVNCIFLPVGGAGGA